MKRALMLVVVLGLMTGVASAGWPIDHPAGLMVYYDFEDGGVGGTTADMAPVAGYPDQPATLNEDLPGLSPVIVDPYGRSGACLDPGLGWATVMPPAAGPNKRRFNTDYTMQAWVALVDRNGDGDTWEEANEQWKFIVGRNGGGWGPRMYSHNSATQNWCQVISVDGGWNNLEDIHTDTWRGGDWSPTADGGAPNGSYDGTGPWHHLVQTYNYATTVMEIYIDGVQWNSADLPEDLKVTVDSWGNMTMGAEDGGGGRTGWLIDDVALWHGYMPQNVVEGLYQGAYTVFDAPVTPEPATLGLLALGGLLIRRKK